MLTLIDLAGEVYSVTGNNHKRSNSPVPASIDNKSNNDLLNSSHMSDGGRLVTKMG